jgi:phosphate transport system substrate-binding protein
VKALTVNGVEATPETVTSKKYPVARPLYMYTNGRPKQGTPLHDFINLSGTPEGKRIIEDTGFIPVK